MLLLTRISERGIVERSLMKMWGYRTLHEGELRVLVEPIQGSWMRIKSQSRGRAVFSTCSCEVSDLLRFCCQMRRCAGGGTIIGEEEDGIANYGSGTRSRQLRGWPL
jgi:hypothetical protein